MTGTNPDCIYIGIGNSDDKLAQAEWADFIVEVIDSCNSVAKVIGAWFSDPVSPFQNACVCIQTPKPAKEKWLRQKLSEIAGRYRQDSVAWAEARTEMLKGS